MTTESRPTLASAAPVLRAWQDTFQALTEGYGDSWRRWVELTTGASGGRLLPSDDVRRTWERVNDSGRELLRAHVAVTGEWLRAPFWLTGAASPVDLQSRYFQLFEAQRGFYRTLLDAALGWQRSVSAATEQVVETAREGLDTQVQTARRVANDQRQAQQATVAAVRDVADATRATVERVTETVQEQTREALDSAREITEQAVEGAREAVNGARAAEQPALVIKGNINAKGEKIYHLPGQPEYDEVKAEAVFSSEQEAQAAGFRPVVLSVRGPIKGKINGNGEKIYHLPGQMNYDRTNADVTFATEEDARGAGFRPAQR